MISRLAVARPDLLHKAPSEWLRYTALGGVLLTTALGSAVSATLTMVTALRTHVAVAVIVGLVWGVVVLNIQRTLLVTATRRRNSRRAVLAALPHFLMAALLGVVISTPLALAVFGPEIDAELTVLRHERSAAFGRQLDTNSRYSTIPELERELAEQERLANGSSETLAIADPAVVSARAQVEKTKVAYEESQRLVLCEFDGTCGTGVPGAGDRLQELRQSRDTRLADYTEANAQLDRAMTAARAATPAAVAAAQARAGELATELEALRTARAAEQASFDERLLTDTGLLSRVTALDSIASQRFDVFVTQTAFFLAVLILELLPLITRLVGPATLYERLVEADDLATARKAARARLLDRQIEEQYEEYRVQVESDRARRQLEAGLRVNERLAKEEAEVFERMVSRWATDASARGDRDLSTFLLELTRPTSSVVAPLRALETSPVYAVQAHRSSKSVTSHEENVPEEPRTVDLVRPRARVRMIEDRPVVGSVSRIDFAFVRMGESDAGPGESATVRVLLDAPYASVSPLTHVVALGDDRTSAPAVFEVVPCRAGTIDLRFRVYTDVDGQLLQEVTSSVEAGEA